MSPVRVFEPGDTAPNLLLRERGDLQTMSMSVQVSQDTLLSELLEPHMGVCHWAACTEGLG